MADEPTQADVNAKVLENLGGTPEPVVEPKVETPVEEPKKEEPVVEPKEETPQIDVEKLKEDLRCEVTKEITDNLVNTLKGDVETKDEYDQFVEKFQKDNGRMPEWKEVATFIKEKAKEELNNEIEEDTKKVEEEQKQREEQEKAAVDSVNKYWDTQLDELQKSGKIPEVKEPTNPNDPGVKARLALFTGLQAEREARAKSGQPDTLSLKEIYYEKYKDPNAQPAGANAPVNGNSRTVSSSDTEGFKYTDIHATPNRPFNKVLRSIFGQNE